MLTQPLKSNSNSSGLSDRSKGFISARVIDIILDDTHPFFEKYGRYDSIGLIFYSDTSKGQGNRKPSSGILQQVARPLFPNIKNYPLIGEIVLIVRNVVALSPNVVDDTLVGAEFLRYKSYYFTSFNVYNHPHHNALPDTRPDPILDETQNRQESEAGLPQNEEENENSFLLGNYFNEKANLKPLLPFEGDILFEGRFGNSIRFGSTNALESNPWSSNEEEIGDPITIIRNGQTDEIDDRSWEHTTESISKDHSSIYLTSTQAINNLTTAGIPTEDPFVISWPSFGREPSTITRRSPNNQKIDEVEDVEEAVQGQDEIMEMTDQEDEVTYIELLPNDKDAKQSEFRNYVIDLFGPYYSLPLAVGIDHVYDVGGFFSNNKDSDSFPLPGINDTTNPEDDYGGPPFGPQVYLYRRINNPTHNVTAAAMIKALELYPPNGISSFPFSDMPIIYPQVEGMFTPNVEVPELIMNLPSYEAYRNVFGNAVKYGYIEDDEELDLAIRSIMLDDLYAELAHVADMKINGIGGSWFDDFDISSTIQTFPDIFGENFDGPYTTPYRDPLTKEPYLNTDPGHKGLLVPEYITDIKSPSANYFIEVIEEKTETQGEVYVKLRFPPIHKLDYEAVVYVTNKIPQSIIDGIAINAEQYNNLTGKKRFKISRERLYDTGNRSATYSSPTTHDFPSSVGYYGDFVPMGVLGPQNNPPALTEDDRFFRRQLISKESEEYIAKWADAYSFVVGLGQTEVDIDENKAYPVTISEDNALPFKLMYVDRNILSKYRYHDLLHGEGRTHQIIEPQLANAIGLDDYEAGNEVAVIQAQGFNRAEAGSNYNKIREQAGLVEDPRYEPIIYFNKSTSKYIFSSEEFEVPREANVIEVEGVGDTREIAEQDAFFKAFEELSSRFGNDEFPDAQLGNIVKQNFRREGGKIFAPTTFNVRGVSSDEN